MKRGSHAWEMQEERKRGGVGVKSFPLPACMLRGWSA
jgi:hypothetical protein